MTEAAELLRFLHVANGHSVTASIAQAEIPGTLSIWADPLHEGPVPGDLSDDDLVRVRAQHLSEDGRTRDEVSAELRRWREAIDGFSRYPELVLWYEHDLFDQLNLIQVLDRLSRLPRGATRVSLISIGSFPGRPSFKGMGELTPDELASLFETRQPVDAPQLEAARAAWAAFRAADPRALEALLATDLSALPFLAAALRRHLEEFPSSANGLSRSEQHLLELIAAGHSGIWPLFPLMHEGETCFFIADTSFWSVVRDLVSASPPLLEAAIESEEAGRLPRGALMLTGTGRDVLAGSADRIRLCGIDRWLGGAHVTAESPWRWDPASAKVTSG